MKVSVLCRLLKSIEDTIDLLKTFCNEDTPCDRCRFDEHKKDNGCYIIDLRGYLAALQEQLWSIDVPLEASQ